MEGAHSRVLTAAGPCLPHPPHDYEPGFRQSAELVTAGSFVAVVAAEEEGGKQDGGYWLLQAEGPPVELAADFTCDYTQVWQAGQCVIRGSWLEM